MWDVGVLTCFSSGRVLFYERSVSICFLLSASLLRFISNSLYFFHIAFYLYSDIVLWRNFSYCSTYQWRHFLRDLVLYGLLTLQRSLKKGIVKVKLELNWRVICCLLGCVAVWRARCRKFGSICCLQFQSRRFILPSRRRKHVPTTRIYIYIYISLHDIISYKTVCTIILLWTATNMTWIEIVQDMI